MSLILENLYLGSVVEATDPIWLEKNKIDFIINCARELDNKCDLKIPLNDDSKQNIIPYLEPTAKKIDEVLSNDKKILIHCFIGRSRSASILVYWLATRKFNNDFEKSLKFLKNKRYEVNPHYSFTIQLCKVLNNM